MRHVLTLLICICLATFSAQGKNGKGKGKGQQEELSAASARVPNTGFGKNDINLIQQYYRGHPVSLPPGLQKKLARGKPLPPGWQKKLQPFPSDIDGRLGPLCDNCGRGVIDGYGVIFDRKTNAVLDIVQLVGNAVR